MSHQATHPNDKAVLWTVNKKILTFVTLGLWFATVFQLGQMGVFKNENNLIPPAAFGLFIPFTLYLLAIAFIPSFKAFLLAQDIRILTAIQLWRVMGFAFLMLYGFKVLPGFFAFPAGYGDVFVGLLALPVLMALLNDNSFVSSKKYLYFNTLGMFDFVTAFGSAALSTGMFPAVYSGELTSSALDAFPLTLFPAFVVPLFAFTHVAAIMQHIEARKKYLKKSI